MGLAKPGETWTVRRALYGLRCAPRAWGLHRDEELRKLSWTDPEGNRFHLVQCTTDSQVWKVCNVLDIDGMSPKGVAVVYVDDILLAMEDCPARKGFATELSKVWALSSEEFFENGRI